MPIEIARAAMSREERDLRARACQLLSGSALLHGSLSARRQKCGKPNCRCTRGERHEVFVLVIRDGGQTRQIPVPKKLVPQVRQWIDQTRAVRDLLEKICRLQVERLLELKAR